MKTKVRLKRVLSVLLMCALITTVVKGPLFLTFATSREMKMDIGVDGDNVTAVLTSDGHLTISGHGETLDYTEETVPFADYVGKIKTLEIKAGVTSVGDYLLYNCGNLAGELELPGTLVRIGDYAFSGDSKEEAPKFSHVINKFTDAEIVTPQDEEKKGPEEETTEESSEALESTEEGERLTDGETAESPEEENSTDDKKDQNGGHVSGGSGGGQSGGSTGGGQNSGSAGETNGGQTGGNAGGTNGTDGTNGTNSTSQSGENTEESKAENQSGGTAVESKPIGESKPTGENKPAGNTDGTTGGAGTQPSDNSNEEHSAQSTEGSQSGSQSDQTQTNPAPEAPNHDSNTDNNTGAINQPAENSQLPADVQVFDHVTVNDLPSADGQPAAIRRSARDHLYVTSSINKEADSTQGTNAPEKQEPQTSNSKDHNSSSTGQDKQEATKADKEETASAGSSTDHSKETNQEPTASHETTSNTNSTTASDSSDKTNEGTTPESTASTEGDTSLESSPSSEEDSALESTAQTSEDTSLEHSGSTGESSGNGTGDGSDGINGINGTGSSGGSSVSGGAAGPEELGPGEALPEESSLEETGEYLVETITEQDIGEEIFYIGQNGIYQCSEENITFMEAAEAAGYKHMDRTVEVTLDETVVTLPITEGTLTAPECPPEITGPKNGDEIFFSQTFYGWTLEDDWQNLGEDAPVYEPGTSIPVDEGWDTVAMRSNWEETCSVLPAVQADIRDNHVIYTVIDENTGEQIPNNTGDTVTCQWQILRGAGQIASPSEAEEAAWTSIDGATEPEYERIPLKEDESSYFRVRIQIEKKAELYSEGVAGLYAVQPITVHYAPGEGASGTGPEEVKIMSGGEFTPSANSFTHQDGLTFTGWKITYSGAAGAQSGELEVAGETVLLPGSAAITLTATGTETEPKVTLTAQWNQAEVLYVSQTLGSDDNPGTKERPLKSLAAAYSHLPELGSAETNVIELLDDYQFEDARLENESLKRNASIRGQGSTKLITSQPNLYLAGDLILEQVELSMTAPDASLSCCGNNLTLSAGTVFQAREGQSLFLVLADNGLPEGRYGERGTSADNPVTAVIDSDKVSLTQMIGTGRNGAGESGHPYSHIVVNRGTIDQVVAGSVFHSGTSYTNADLEIHGGTVREVIGGTLPSSGSGILKGNVNIRITGGAIVSVYGASAGEQNSSFCKTEGDIRLAISGGTIDRVYASGMTGSIEGNVDVQIDGGTIGTFYGGGAGASDKTGVYGSGSGTVTGDINITITGGTIGHGFYAGGTAVEASPNSGRVEGTITTLISGNAVINGDVYAGGCGVETKQHSDESKEPGISSDAGSVTKKSDSTMEGDNTMEAGSVTGSTTLTIRGGQILGSVYGGGHASNTGGKAGVYLYGGSVSGSVYGGASGSGYTESSEAEVHTSIGTPDQPVSVYGGGTAGSPVTGESALTIGNGAVIYGDIYGGGQAETGSASLTISGGTVNGNAYGGGEQSDTSGSITVTQSGGTVTGSLYGGGNQASVHGTIDLRQTAGSVAGSIYGGCAAAGAVNGLITVDVSGTSTNVFGGGSGAQTAAEGGTQVTVGQGAQIKNDVYGGGEDRSVTNGGIVISLSGAAPSGSVFGGGKNADVNGSVAIHALEGSAVPAIFGGALHSGTVSHPVITISGSVTNVFGGGYGAGTASSSPVITVTPSGRVAGQIIGGAIAGNVRDGAGITLSEGSFANTIYGGGQEAGVSGPVTITTEAGSKVENLYGGSSMSGEVTGPVITVKGEAGSIFGGGKGDHTKVSSPTVTLETGASARHVYGGGEEGSTTGTNTVLLKGGTSDMVFGGGLSASSQSTVVTLEVGANAVHLYGGARESGEISGSAMVTVNGTCANIYGGGLGKQTTVGSSSVTVGGRAGESGSISGKRIHGGGDSGTVSGNAAVIVSGPVSADIYGGGKGSDSLIGGNTSVTLMKEINGAVYGGGDTGPVAGNAKITVMPDASVSGTIYGGGLRMGLDGAANIEIQKDAFVMGTVYGGSCESGEIKQGTDITLYGTVRRAGEQENSGSMYGGGDGIRTVVADSAKMTVAGTVEGNVYGGSGRGTISGSTQIEIANGSVAGSIYGGGQSGNVSGSRDIHITGTSMDGDHALASIQDAETLILDSCQLELGGRSGIDESYRNGTDGLEDQYSLAHIDRLVLQNNSTLKMQAPVYVVTAVESRDASGSLADATGAVKNTIYLRQGIAMELRTGSRNTGADYGPVLGCLRLGSYDGSTTSAANTGVYVLGAWSDTSQSSFLYADDIYDSAGQKLLYEKDTPIMPSGKKDVWSSWSIGTDQSEASAQLIMSNRPGTGKTAEFFTEASDEERIYQLIPDSIKLEAREGTFTLVQPENLDKAQDANHTLALTLSTGAGATEGPENLAYITGNTADGTGEFVPVSTSSSGILETRTLGGQSDLSFQITLDNKTGVSQSDSEAEFPLQVSFDMAVYRPLSDGTRIQNGQVTVTLQIRRENIRQYSDCLASPGKQYRNARYLYDMEAEGGAADVTISRGSSVTLQYTSAGENRRSTSEGDLNAGSASEASSNIRSASEASSNIGSISEASSNIGSTSGTPLASNITDHQLSFSTYAGISEEGTLWNPEILPAGITILAIDRSSSQPVYYHYTTDGSGSTIRLSSFVKNGSEEYYSCQVSDGAAENLLFILDFAAQNTYSADRLCAGLSPVYEDGTEGPAGQVVFGIGGDNLTYGLTKLEARSRNNDAPTYMEDDTITIPVMTVITGGTATGTDTVGEGRQMAVRIRLKNLDTDTYVKIPSTWVARNAGGDYAASKNGVLTVPLSSSLTALNCQLNLKLEQSSLPAGAYRLEMKLAQGVMAQYAEEVDNVFITHDFHLEKYRYSVNAVLRGGSSRRVIPAEGGRSPLAFTMQYTASGNPDTSRVTLVTELQQKTNGSYQNIDMANLFKNASGLRDTHSWGTGTISYTFKKGTLETGSYRLRFTVVDGSGNVVNESAESFLILPQ